MKRDYLKLALVAMVVNVLLSYLVPLTLPETRNNNLNEVRSMFVHHKATLFTSSIIVTLAVVVSVILSENLPF